MTVFSCVWLAIAYKKDDSNFAYYALVMATFRNIMPLFDLDGVSLPRDDGNN